MKADRWVILSLLVLLAGVAVYYLVSLSITASRQTSENTIQFVIPTASGIAAGQIVTTGESAMATEIGTVSSIEPVSEGILVTVLVANRTALPPGPRAIIRPAASPRPATLEIIATPGGVPLKSLSARIPATVELGPPEGLVEPTPRWPLEN